jgi:alkylation response protein AidB-like acyl-CoA dehydrogenase
MIVDLSLTDEQRMIEDSVLGFLRQELPIERLREARNHGGAAERARWNELAGLGLFALAVPSTDGGLGLGPAEEALVARALGLNLASPALLAQMAAPHFTEDRQLRSAFAAGDQRAALAYPSGADSIVILDGEGAGYILLITPSGATLVSREGMKAGDPVSLVAETIAAERVASPDTEHAEVSQAGAQHRIAVLLAAYLTGVAQAATSMAVDYAGTREQFGQPIGGFQAIKHACADMAMRAAAAEAQCFHAAVTMESGLDDAVETTAAFVLASRAANENGRANIQIHGGIGFTAECDAHLLLKTAIAISALGPGKQAAANTMIGR